jgi:hypothetical protein
MHHSMPPWQFSVDFQLKRQTQERPDKNDHSQDYYVLEGGCDNNGPDDIASNEKLET